MLRRAVYPPPGARRHRVVLYLFLVASLSLLGAEMAWAQCPPVTGDVDQNGHVTPHDALQALQIFLGAAASPCARLQANVFAGSDMAVTPADVLCILHRFVASPSCLDPLLADAGPDQFLAPQQGVFPTAFLDGSASRDPSGGPLTFTWSFADLPANSALSNTDLMTPTAVGTAFVPDVMGLYALNLTVVDEAGETATTTVLVNAQEIGDHEGSCNCDGSAGETVDMSVEVTDAAGAPVPDWPVTFTLMQGDGMFIVDDEPTRAALSTLALTLPSRCTRLDPLPAGAFDAVVCLTNADGVATARLLIGLEPVHLVIARTRTLQITPLIFCVRQDDRDGDCLPDALEVSLHLDPDTVDSNGNGVPDGAEDADGDGLSNATEVIMATDPSLPDNTDSDGDGLRDGDEFTLGTDPTNHDSDGDGFNDGDEVSAGSDPLNRANLPPSLFSAPLVSVHNLTGPALQTRMTTGPLFSVRSLAAPGIRNGTATGALVTTQNTVIPELANRMAIAPLLSVNNISGP